MALSQIAAWAALALIAGTAVIGSFLRRWGSGAFSLRLRPHFVLGYAALGTALLHTTLAMPVTGSANGNGLWFAGFATAGLGLQAFSGTNLQSPGSYRRPLRRWHIGVFWITAFLALGHVLLNGPVL